MGQVISIIQTIINGIKSPIKAGMGAAFALFVYFFVLIQKGEFRERKSEEEKDEQKGESNTDLENSNSEADSSIRDRLSRRNTTRQEAP